MSDSIGSKLPQGMKKANYDTLESGTTVKNDKVSLQDSVQGKQTAF